MERYQALVIAHSESVMKNCLKRPLGEKSRWRHIRLAIKPRYLGNHAWQLKSYYTTLSESHGRSFRIRHERSPGTPPSGEITMKSYPVSNTISLSRKPCTITKKLLYNCIRKSWSLFQNHVMKNRFERPLVEKLPWRNIRLAIKPLISETVHRRLNVTTERYQEVILALSESVMKNRLKRPLAEKSRWRHIWLAIKPRYLGNHAFQIKFLLITVMRSWSFSNFYKKKQQIIINKSYQFINVINGVSHSHKTANKLFLILLSSIAC